MKVMVLPADVAGCGYYRLIWAAEHLQSEGHDVIIQYPADKDIGLKVFFAGEHEGDPNAIITDVEIPDNADVIVMQRITHMWHAKVIPILRKKGVAVVIDMDDDLSCIHRKNQAWLNYHPLSNTPYSWRHADESCRQATVCTVSTPSLLKVYARHGRGEVIDNFVPERYLHINPQPRDPAFGWPGTTMSHPADLDTCGRSVQQLRDDGYAFRVIGPPSKVKTGLKLRDEPEYTGVVKIFDWPARIAELQVALAPLEASQFNQSKSRLKLAEASSVGVPWVASARTEYRKFYNESGGAGLIVDTPKDWYRAVKQLMDDEPLRKELGERGREYMRTQTIEANSWRWWQAWTRAYEIEQGIGK
jgi:glycosyltransferase involved in cell wall biosynthesis